jgi:hypothetical protein
LAVFWGVFLTRPLRHRLFYYYFWHNGGDIFENSEKTAPRGPFFTFFAVPEGPTGLSTPPEGCLNEDFFDPPDPRKTRVFGGVRKPPFLAQKWPSGNTPITPPGPPLK